ncbi:hypothetical protein P175DRAFT_021508 [Aspergillus ochraceoroseus IBT 24754]|uniref:Oxidoreductase-like domain-containing protein n=1 Tax=Aspergillus ochraceoroseus IBT 24754 TaxID=1392256 RepID=A0A2T5M6J0_9EURO|nr:uncharacterized protein P175DRAFT_021508 [Aspergillus ochraceoroseus IBT 24754]PTU24150.1 hypothetical protein P175DRAFT_021508 [Aspergillus ochraceoroseus IBT 24754]
MATPLYDPKDVPRIKNAKRLSAIRSKQLVRAAARACDDPPPPPGLGECCGSSCDPCVNDLWKEELACWRERWGVSSSSSSSTSTSTSTSMVTATGTSTESETKPKGKMPGSFDW